MALMDYVNEIFPPTLGIDAHQIRGILRGCSKPPPASFRNNEKIRRQRPTGRPAATGNQGGFFMR